MINESHSSNIGRFFILFFMVVSLSVSTAGTAYPSPALSGMEQVNSDRPETVAMSETGQVEKEQETQSGNSENGRMMHSGMHHGAWMIGMMVVCVLLFGGFLMMA
jgi:hypothetical protein